MKMTKQMSNRYQNNCAKWIQVTQTDDFTTLELLFQIKSFKVKSPLVWTLGKDTQLLEIKNGRQDTTFSLALLYGCTIQLNTSYSPLLFRVSLSWLGYDNMEVTEVAECDIESWPCVSYWVFFIMQATSWCWCMAVISPLSAITHKSSLRFGSVPPSESLLGFISVPSTCTATQPRNSLEIVSWTIVGVTLFYSCLSNISTLRYLRFSILKSTVSCCSTSWPTVTLSVLWNWAMVI